MIKDKIEDAAEMMRIKLDGTVAIKEIIMPIQNETRNQKIPVNIATAVYSSLSKWESDWYR